MLPVDTGGVGSYRCLFPGRELALHGHEVTLPLRDEEGKRYESSKPLPVRVGVTDSFELEPWFDADVYVLQRRMEKKVIRIGAEVWSIAQVAAWLRSIGKVVVSEVDDWYPGLPAENPGVAALKKLARFMDVAALLDTFRSSDCLTVSTSALAEGHANDCADVRVLPNFLDWGMWRDVEQQSEVERPGGRVRVGWMGWLHWHPRDLDVLRGVIGPFLERNGHVDFVSIGEPQAGDEPDGYVSVHDYLQVPADRRLVAHAVPFAQLPRIVPNIDIGLVPLDASFFNDCKSHLKGLEYSACGIVPVCSPTRPYREFIRDGETGLLARRAHDWIRSLELLVNDDELRRRMGRAARVVAEANTVQDHWPLWEAAYASAGEFAIAA